jgi:hypothetical protein
MPPLATPSFSRLSHISNAASFEAANRERDVSNRGKIRHTFSLRWSTVPTADVTPSQGPSCKQNVAVADPCSLPKWPEKKGQLLRSPRYVTPVRSGLRRRQALHPRGGREIAAPEVDERLRRIGIQLHFFERTPD